MTRAIRTTKRSLITALLVPLFFLFLAPQAKADVPSGDLYVPMADTYEVFKSKVTSPFNPTRLHPSLGIIRPHNGTDFGYGCDAPIYSFADGEVTQVYVPAGVGPGTKGDATIITIQHSDTLSTKYLHWKPGDETVKVGDKVGAGQQISKVNTYGGGSTGCHLHFEVIKGGTAVNSIPFLDGLASRLKVPDGSVTGPGASQETPQSGVSISGGGGIVSEDELTGMPEKRKFYEDPETGEKVEIPDHMLWTDLSEDEAASAAQLMASVETYNESSKVNWLNVGVMLMGLGMIFYSVLLIVAYSFDKVNTFFQVPLVSVLTFGRLQAKESDDPDVDGFIPPKGVFIRSGIAFLLGILLVSGWFYWLMLWVFQLAQAWAVENL